MSTGAVFLDLNGTLVMWIKVEVPEEYRPIPGALKAVSILNKAGFLCPVVTVQSRIAKGLYSEVDFRSWFTSFARHAAEYGASFAGLYLCPHRFHSGCPCGKPNTGLYDRAVLDYDVDCSRSYVVGDTVDDLEAGQHVGMQNCLVLTGQGVRAAERLHYPPSYIGADLPAVAEWIASSSTRA